jgi:transcriptional regulator with XRE-family HTH domain
MAVVREQLRGHNERLRRAIFESGLTVDEVARRCGMDPKSLARAIAGRQIPHPRNRYAIATVVKQDVDWLWPGVDGRATVHSPQGMAGVEQVYANRSDFLSCMPPEILFSGATSIASAGLSNNLLCQHYADQRLEQLVTLGTEVMCLFLDPAGAATAAREHEEGYEPGHLAQLTGMNILLMQRLRGRLPDSVQARLQLATYDETIRYNIIAVERPEDSTLVVQPYLPHNRGVESPTLVIRQSPEPGLFETFQRVLADLSEKATPC